jgi:hypothetical protein
VFGTRAERFWVTYLHKHVKGIEGNFGIVGGLQGITSWLAGEHTSVYKLQTIRLGTETCAELLSILICRYSFYMLLGLWSILRQDRVHTFGSVSANAALAVSFSPACKSVCEKSTALQQRKRLIPGLEDGCLPSCWATQSVRSLPSLQRFLLPPSSGR